MEMFLFNLVLGLTFGFILAAVRNGGSFTLLWLIDITQDGWNALRDVVACTVRGTRARAFFARSNLPQVDEQKLRDRSPQVYNCLDRNNYLLPEDWFAQLAHYDMADDDSAMTRWNTAFWE